MRQQVLGAGGGLRRSLAEAPGEAGDPPRPRRIRTFAFFRAYPSNRRTPGRLFNVLSNHRQPQCAALWCVDCVAGQQEKRTIRESSQENRVALDERWKYPLLNFRDIDDRLVHLVAMNPGPAWGSRPIPTVATMDPMLMIDPSPAARMPG